MTYEETIIRFEESLSIGMSVIDIIRDFKEFGDANEEALHELTMIHLVKKMEVL